MAFWPCSASAKSSAAAEDVGFGARETPRVTAQDKNKNAQISMVEQGVGMTPVPFHAVAAPDLQPEELRLS